MRCPPRRPYALPRKQLPAPSRHNRLFEDEETAVLTGEAGKEGKTAAGRISADDLSADELQQVFKSGLHLSDWAMLRLVSKTWKALADSCADCVNVSLTCAEWPEQPMEKSAEHDWQVVQPWVTEAAFSRLCYVLETFPAAVVTVVHASLREPTLKLIESSTGDIFAGRRICFYSTTPGDLAVVPALQELGDCCRRLLSSRGVDVQVSVCMGFWYEPLDDRVARVVNCLAPHLCGLSAHPRHQQGFRRQHLLPAAAQLEQVTGIADARCLSWLGHFHLLKVLHIDVQRQHPAFLLPPLPRLHTLSLRFSGTLLREVNWQCLFSCAPALRQLVLDCAEHPCHEGSHDGLDRWDIEALVGLQCQQLDLLTLETDAVDEHTVQLLAGIQCPVKLSINTYDWRRLNSAPLNVLLALLPNLVALTFISLDTKLLDALWDQHGPCLPDVQCLEIWRLCLAKPDSHLPLQRILSRCPALKHLSLHADDPPLSRAQRSEVYARLSHAFQNAKLVSLVCE